MASIVKEFREFINRGNVVDLAVAVVIGTAFGAVITSFTNDIFAGLLGALGGQPSLGDLSITVGAGEIRWGKFVDSVISFLIVAVALFVIIKAFNSVQRLGRRNADGVEETPETELDVLREIRDRLASRD